MLPDGAVVDATSELSAGAQVYFYRDLRDEVTVKFDIPVLYRDDGIVVHSQRWHDSPADFWDDAARRAREYRGNRQAGQRQYVELWCEAVGMAQQLSRVADEFSVPVYSNGGFVSVSAVRSMTENALRQNVPTVILHVGDFDPSGESIFTSMTEGQVDRVCTALSEALGKRP